MMKVVVSGGTGFVGGALVEDLVADDHEVTVLTRSGRGVPDGAAVAHWSGLPVEDGQEPPEWWQAVDGADGIVHLAGETIFGYWTTAKKERIRDSRVQGTRAIVQAIERVDERPEVLVSASGANYYGHRGSDRLTEAEPAGDDFLAQVCVAWEAEARRAEAFGVRVVRTRNAVVLAPDGGSFPLMALPFRLFAGGPVGAGEQYMPWIHLEDTVRILRFALEETSVTGPVNATAPEPLPNREFSRILGEVMGRPSWLPAPPFALKLVMGEMADALLLTSMRLVPARLRECGFAFRYAELRPALEAILGTNKASA